MSAAVDVHVGDRLCGDDDPRASNDAVAVSNLVVQHSGGLAIAQATCPTGTQPLGGGGLTTFPAFAVNMNSTLPTANGWRVDRERLLLGG